MVRAKPLMLAAFWGLNASLVLMVFVSLPPIGTTLAMALQVVLGLLGRTTGRHAAGENPAGTVQA